MAKVVVLASFNMDFVMRAERQPTPGETLQGQFAMHLGGKGFNQAIAARRLGAEVAVVGRVGDDEFGHRFLWALDREGIDRTHVTLDREAGTGVASIVVDAGGENAIVQAPRANRSVSQADVEHATTTIERADVALLQLETSDAAAMSFASKACAAGVRVLLNPAPAAPVCDALLAAADILAPNALEAATITRMPVRSVADAKDAALALRERHGGSAVVTLGDRGCVAASRDLLTHAPAHQVDAIDTVGAGDAFCAALAVAMAEGADLTAAVRFANAAGALATTKHGAEPSMPRRADVETFVANGVTR